MSTLSLATRPSQNGCKSSLTMRTAARSLYATVRCCFWGEAQLTGRCPQRTRRSPLPVRSLRSPPSWGERCRTYLAVQPVLDALLAKCRMRLVCFREDCGSRRPANGPGRLLGAQCDNTFLVRGPRQVREAAQKYGLTRWPCSAQPDHSFQLRCRSVPFVGAGRGVAPPAPTTCSTRAPHRRRTTCRTST